MTDAVLICVDRGQRLCLQFFFQQLKSLSFRCACSRLLQLQPSIASCQKDRLTDSQFRRAKLEKTWRNFWPSKNITACRGEGKKMLLWDGPQPVFYCFPCVLVWNSVNFCWLRDMFWLICFQYCVNIETSGEDVDHLCCSHSFCEWRQVSWFVSWTVVFCIISSCVVNLWMSFYSISSS